MAEGASLAASWENVPPDLSSGPEKMIEIRDKRIAELEAVVRDILALERISAPRMDGKRREFAYIRPGPSLAAVLDAARKLLGEGN